MKKSNTNRYLLHALYTLCTVLTLLTLLHLVNAETIPTLGNVRAGDSVDLIQVPTNASFCNFTSLQYPNQTKIYFSQVMANTNGEYLYTLPGIYTLVLGEYKACTQCDPSGIIKTACYRFLVTPNGEDPAGTGLQVFIYILFISFTFILIFLFVINLAKLATASTTIFDLALSLGIYLVLLFTYWLSKNYLLNTFISDHAGLYLTLTAFGGVVLPFVSFVVTIFVKSTQKKSVLSVEEIRGRFSFV